MNSLRSHRQSLLLAACVGLLLFAIVEIYQVLAQKAAANLQDEGWQRSPVAAPPLSP